MKTLQLLRIGLAIMFLAAFCCPIVAQQNETEGPAPQPFRGPPAIFEASDGLLEYGPPTGPAAPGQEIRHEVDEFTEPVGEPTPLWQQLENLEPRDKENAEIGLEVSGTFGPALREWVQAIENAWNSGDFERAVVLLRQLEERTDAPDVAVGINWRTPKTIGAMPKWGTDVPVGAHSSVRKAVLDYHAGTGNLFVVTRRYDTASTDDAWNVFFSNNDGDSWSETYQWMTVGQSIADISAVVIDDYLYIAYVGDSTGFECRTRRCFASSGTVDNVYFWYTAFDKGVAIEELAFVSTADAGNTRLYLTGILSDDTLVYVWDDQNGASWSEIATGITNAESGLDLYYNNGYSAASWLQGCYVDNQGMVTHFDRTWVLTQLDPGGDPCIAAYEDDVIVVYEYDYTNGPGIRYKIQYDGSGTWLSGTIASPAVVGEYYYKPDVTGRNDAGFSVVYGEEAGAFDPCWFTRRDYDTANWTLDVSYNDVDTYSSGRNTIEAIPSGAGGISHGVVYLPSGTSPYFDRIDYPFVDIKCNGGDSGVAVPIGTPAELTYNIIAGPESGIAVDVWLVVVAPMPPFTFSYDGAGPTLGWWGDLSHVFYTGPITRMSGTCLNSPVPPGAYTAFVGIEQPADGVLSLPAIALDRVTFHVP
jgi:hypothetical protein